MINKRRVPVDEKVRVSRQTLVVPEPPCNDRKQKSVIDVGVVSCLSLCMENCLTVGSGLWKTASRYSKIVNLDKVISFSVSSTFNSCM